MRYIYHYILVEEFICSFTAVETAFLISYTEYLAKLKVETSFVRHSKGFSGVFLFTLSRILSTFSLAEITLLLCKNMTMNDGGLAMVQNSSRVWCILPTNLRVGSRT